MANIRKGDLVQVITGPSQERGGDRGKQGKVIDVQVGKDRVIVEGINYVTKHVRVGQTQRGTKTGGIETRESPIHVSNIALVDPDTKQPARVGFKVVTDPKTGKVSRERFFKPSRRTAKRRPEPAEGPAKADKKAVEGAEKAEKKAAEPKSTTTKKAASEKPAESASEKSAETITEDAE
jgi:large subunit ribosomal protein L24